ncbi:MAG TPA: LacI family DNA-binding transcriptional regulator [Rectinemataceae bacterium]|nr:LacI family DNA-binding transcriptional regulator [Rectinemataceae bacterium]
MTGGEGQGPGVTIRDVARAAGVSTATVSRVLNADARVSPETALRVRASVDELGYKMNQVARSLKTRATRTIGVVAPRLASDFFMLLAESMDRELSAHGYGLFVCSSRESVREEEERLHLMAERLVDAVVMIPATDRGAHYRPFMGRGTPFLLVDRLVSDLSADAVLVDNAGGSRDATRALISEGHRRIGFLGGSLDVSTARERYEGYRAAMAEAGLPVERDFVRFGSLHVESGYRSMAELLARPGAPEAYFIVNADTHVGATNYLMTEGRAFSRRIVFASFDEMPYSPLLQFCRWSVSQPIDELGAQAARMALARIGGSRPAEAEVLRLQTRLIRHEGRAHSTETDEIE